ncbi:Hypothetical predicted protein, partial [Pelobates cultripes]
MLSGNCISDYQYLSVRCIGLARKGHLATRKRELWLQITKLLPANEGGMGTSKSIYHTPKEITHKKNEGRGQCKKQPERKEILPKIETDK